MHESKCKSGISLILVYSCLFVPRMGGAQDPARMVAVAAAAAAGIAAMAVIRYTVRQIFSKDEDYDQKETEETPETTRPPSVEPSMIETRTESPPLSTLPHPAYEGDMVCTTRLLEFYIPF